MFSLIIKGFSIFRKLEIVSNFRMLILFSFILTGVDVIGLLALGQLINISLLDIHPSESLIALFPWFDSQLFLSLVVLIKVVLSYILISLLNKYTMHTEATIRASLFKQLMFEKYSKTIDSPIEDVIYIIQIRTKQYIESFLIPSIRMIVEISTISTLLVILLYVSFFHTIVISFVVVAVALIYHFSVNSLMYNLSVKYNKSEKNVTKIISETKLGLREFIVFSSEKVFGKFFFRTVVESSDNYRYMANITGFWKYLPEVLVIIVTIAMVLTELNLVGFADYSGYGIVIFMKFLSTAGVLITSTSNLKKSEEIFLDLSDLFEANSIKYDTFINKEKVEKILVKNIEIRHGDSNRYFSIFANFTLDSGLYLMRSESGSGKSSLLDVIMGLKDPSKGRVHLQLNNMNIDASPKFFSFSSQNPVVFSGTIMDNFCPSGEERCNIELCKRLVIFFNLNECL